MKTYKLALAVIFAISTPLATRAAGEDAFRQKTRVGSAMPDFIVEQLDGRQFHLAAYRGKVIVVNFWATWCSPCKREMPVFEKDVWQKYKDNPEFTMIAIAREQKKGTIKKFQSKQPYTFPLAVDPKRKTYSLFADSGIPRSYIVDRKGNIRFQTVGAAPGDLGQMKRILAEVMAEK